MWLSGICELKLLKHTRLLCPTSCGKNECGKWESMMRDVCIPGTLYQLAPLVMPSSKYSSGYRSSQGCPLCMRGFSCTHKNTHKWEVNNDDRCTQVFKPCLPTDFTKKPMVSTSAQLHSLFSMTKWSHRQLSVPRLKQIPQCPVTCEYALDTCWKILSSGDGLYWVICSLSSS